LFLTASWINPENIGITHFLKGRTQDNSKIPHDLSCTLKSILNHKSLLLIMLMLFQQALVIPMKYL